MYGSSLHAEVFCLAQPSSVKTLSLDSATSLAHSSFARCTVVLLGLHMDSPSQQQRRIAHVDPSTSDTQAFRHYALMSNTVWTLAWSYRGLDRVT